ncbi:GNAT family N-acetyltransferase [Micromonospora andamanensis]|uniref:GNAT family N-acetyltransferase n=1 Tax=Micromonospora andamanensis TaxID=1287068 RepID=A0ABQ4HWC2_9ACTN|nr:GNAT family N-acetyltransferase [Micromonospora andamanensis]GIJ09941.1 GNAT family N-acetyltransferase [Micromonospora andamanensis]GIJ39919.1 GNAT family N-acetyltransferase [Micromonospora andamanensis]
MTSLTIRERQPADLPGCVDLLAEVHRVDGYPLNWPDDPTRWLCPPELWRAWVTETRDGGLAGHLAVHRTPPAGHGAPGRPTAEVARLFVAPTFRRRRVGAYLLRQARRWAAEQHLDLALEVVDQVRSPAVALYEREGWRHVATETARWNAPDGSEVTLRRFVLPAGDGPGQGRPGQ